MSDYSSIGQYNKNNSQTQGFAAAVQRAKLVAAKIESGGSKRPLEDSLDPSPAKKLAGIESGSIYQTSPMSAAAAATAGGRLGGGPNMGGGPNAGGGPNMGGGPNIGGNGPPGQNDINSVNEYIRVPDEMVGLIIGRRGEQITRLQAETGCKIQMAPDSGGQPDRLCTLTGSREAVGRARDLVNSIVNNRGRENVGGMMEGNNGGPPMGGPGPQSNPMRNSMGGGGGMGGGMGGGHATEELVIPGNKVGLIIGKGGETIKQLQERSGAKMVIIQDGPNPEFEKPLRITGDASKVEHAKQLVFELLQEREMQQANRRQNNDFDDSSSGGGGSNGFEVIVPREAVGLVIGAGGFMIKNIQAKTGCKVQFHQDKGEGPGDKRCILQGNPQQVEDAKQMIDDLIDSMNGVRRNNRGGSQGGGNGGQRNGGGDYNSRGSGGNGSWDGGPSEPKITLTFCVTSTKCSQIIGRGGEVIRQIIAQSGAHVELDRKANQSDRNARPFIIRGTPEAVENAKRIIVDKCGGAPINFMPEGSMMGGGGGGMGGPSAESYYSGSAAPGPGGGGAPAWGYNPHWHPSNAQQGGPGGVAINPATGQPDYSQQWIDYYRSQGMHREADAIEQQVKGNKGGAATTQGQPQAAQAAPQQQQQSRGAVGGASGNGSGEADYSAQWAEYYRSIGKVKEAEAIEAQMKQKQAASAPSAGPIAPGGPTGSPAGPYGQPQSFPGYPQYYAPQPFPGGYPDQPQ